MAVRVDLSRAMQKAARRTINRLLVRGRKLSGQAVRAKYNIKAGDLKKATIIRRITGRGSEGQLLIRGKPLRVYYFGARETSRGTTIRIKRSGGRKVIPSAFIATMPSGLIQVWIRSGSARAMQSGRYAGQMRQPIRQLFTTSPAKMFEVKGEEVFKRMVVDEAGPMFEKELEFFLSKA